jgi:simple sugar transport system ATP-binding protein
MQPAVEFRGISKHFGAVKANTDVSFSIAKGSIHGLVGENGAGKSTLMSILYGYYRADGGDILLDGQARRIHNSQEAIALGIGMVHQHFMLVENMTVLDNVMLGSEGGFKLKPPRRWKRNCARSARATASTSIRWPPSTICRWARSSAWRSSSRSTAAPTS